MRMFFNVWASLPVTAQVNVRADASKILTANFMSQNLSDCMALFRLLGFMIFPQA